MLPLAVVFAVLAALIHVRIFVLETLQWDRESTRRLFGTTAEQAAMSRQLAANQGVYNLMLAVVVAVGLALLGVSREVGLALVLAGTGCMLVAAVYLVSTDRSKARAAAVQGTAPLLAVVFAVLALAA